MKFPDAERFYHSSAVNRQNFVESLIYRSHSLVAFRHRSDERKPIAVTGDRLP